MEVSLLNINADMPPITYTSPYATCNAWLLIMYSQEIEFCTFKRKYSSFFLRFDAGIARMFIDKKVNSSAEFLCVCDREQEG